MNLFVEVLLQKSSGSYKDTFNTFKNFAELSRRFELILPSYPHIPCLGINPWQEKYADIFHAPSMIHIRTRDFSCTEKFEAFLAQYTKKIGKNIYGLLIFGDLYGNPGDFEIKPWEAIARAKEYFSKVGIVVNPTPVLRSAKEELESFALKLKENPDFIVTQCVYDIETMQIFFKIAGINLNKIFMNLGYWNKESPYFKLGIANPNRLTTPPQQIVDLAMNECQGIYVCGNIPRVDILLKKQIENSLT